MHDWRWQVIAPILFFAGCEPGTSDAPVAQSSAAVSKTTQSLLLSQPSHDDIPHLHNVVQLTEQLFSGSEPHGAEGFAELKKLGVDVIVSVDGARPNVEAARERGLHYVHIPIGYDGIPKEAGESLARVVREAAGSGETIYFHCHHGKHRGPAAAAVACIAAGVADQKTALDILTQAGTSKDYAGLWRDVGEYQPPPSDAQLPELVEVAQVDSLAAAMAQLDRGFDNLKLCEAAKWKTPADHPDIVPAQEALMVKEALREAARNLAADHDAKFIKWLGESETIAAKLEEDLRGDNVTGASESFTSLGEACQQCHVEYRN